MKIKGNNQPNTATDWMEKQKIEAGNASEIQTEDGDRKAISTKSEAKRGSAIRWWELARI